MVLYNVIYFEVNVMDIKVNDILEMKKAHPCGEKKFLVLRAGMDFRIRCVKCEREVMVPRVKIEKNIKKVIRENENV
jgi:hypothetical protein